MNRVPKERLTAYIQQASVGANLKDGKVEESAARNQEAGAAANLRDGKEDEGEREGEGDEDEGSEADGKANDEYATLEGRLGGGREEEYEEEGAGADREDDEHEEDEEKRSGDDVILVESLFGIGVEAILLERKGDEVCVGTVNVRSKCGIDGIDDIAQYGASLFASIPTLDVIMFTECGMKQQHTYRFERAINSACRTASVKEYIRLHVPPNSDAATTHHVIAAVRSDACEANVIEEWCYAGRALSIDVRYGSDDNAVRVVGVYGHSGGATSIEGEEERRMLQETIRKASRGRRTIVLGDWNTVACDLDRSSGSMLDYDKAPHAAHRGVADRLDDVLDPSRTCRASEEVNERHFTFEGSHREGRKGAKSRIDRAYVSEHLAENLVAAVHGPTATHVGLDHRPVIVMLKRSKGPSDPHSVTDAELPEGSPWKNSWRIKQSECTRAAEREMEERMGPILVAWSAKCCQTLQKLVTSTAATSDDTRRVLEETWREVGEKSRMCVGSAPTERKKKGRSASRGDRLRRCEVLLQRAKRRTCLRQKEAYAVRKSLRALGMRHKGICACVSRARRTMIIRSAIDAVRRDRRREARRERKRREATVMQLAARGGASVGKLLRTVMGSTRRRRMLGSHSDAYDMYMRRFAKMHGTDKRFEEAGGVIGLDEKGHTTYKFPLDEQGKAINAAQPSGSRADELSPAFAAIDDPVTRTEFDDALQNVSQFKAAGPDGWTAGALRVLPAAIKSVMFELSAAIHRTGVLPPSYRAATVICLAKGTSAFTATNHRPITLMQHIMKVQEKIYLTRIKKVLENHPGIFNCSHQCGGIRARSTHDAARLLLAMIEDSIRRHDDGEDPSNSDYEGLWLFSSDVAAAFDGISEASKEVALRRLGLPEKFIQFVKESQTNAPRRVRFDDGTFTKMFRLQRGASQGSLLSPFIWLAFVSMWLDYAEQSGKGYTPKGGAHIPGPAFVDDIINAAHNEKNMRQLVQGFTEFLRAHSASVSKPKSILLARPQRRITKQLMPIQVRIVDWMQPRGHEESTVELEYGDTGAQYKFVGMYFCNERVSKRSETIARKTVSELARLVELRAVSPRVATKVVSTVIEAKLSYIFKTFVVPWAELQRWTDRMRVAVASTYTAKGKYCLARHAYHGKHMLNRPGLGHIQLHHLASQTLSDNLASDNPVTLALRHSNEAGTARWRRRGTALNDHELVSADDPFSNCRATRLRYFLAEFGVTIHCRSNRTGAIPVGRRSPPIGARWGQSESDYTIQKCLHEAITQWTADSNDEKRREIENRPGNEYAREDELVDEVDAEPTTRAHVRPSARGVARELARMGINSWEHILSGRNVISWEEMKDRCLSRGFRVQSRAPQAWNTLVTAARGGKEDAMSGPGAVDAKVDEQVGTEAGPAARYESDSIPSYHCTMGRIKISLSRAAVNQLVGECDFEDDGPDEIEFKRLAWSITAQAWKVPMDKLRREYAKRKKVGDITYLHAKEYGAGLLKLINREGSARSDRPIAAQEEATILGLYLAATEYRFIPFVMVESVRCEDMSMSALKHATKARFKGCARMPSREELVAAVKDQRQLPAKFSNAIKVMKRLVKAQQLQEAQAKKRKPSGVPLASHTYDEVWLGLGMRKLQTKVQQLILGSDGSVTPATRTTNTLGGFAVAIGSVNSSSVGSPRVIVCGILPARHELESSTTAELYGIAAQAASALKVRRAHGDADSTSALAWANKGSAAIRPGDLVRSPASGAIEVMLMCRERRERNAYDAMTFGKVKAHVSGLRTDEEVTNEAVDGGSKAAAQGVDVTCTIGGRHGTVGTVVIAIGGDEEAAPPKQIVNTLREDLAIYAAIKGNEQRQAMLTLELRSNTLDATTVAAIIGRSATERDRDTVMSSVLEFGPSNAHGGARKPSGDVDPTRLCQICIAMGHHELGDVEHSVNCSGVTALARKFARNCTGIVQRGMAHEERHLEESRAWRERITAGECDVVTHFGEDEWSRVCDCESPPPQNDCECEPKVFIARRAMNQLQRNLRVEGSDAALAQAKYACTLARGERTRGGQLRQGGVVTKRMKVSVMTLRSVRPEIWSPLCQALGIQAEVATTAASRGVCYGSGIEWSSELDDSELTGKARWSNIICLAHSSDEEIASTLEYFEKWVAADATATQQGCRRATVVLIRGPRRMDAREHGVAQPKWAEFLRIESGHRLTRRVGIHTSDHRKPVNEVGGLTVLVHSAEGADERWPIGRSDVGPIATALDGMGITSDSATFKLPTKHGWRQWYTVQEEEDAPTHSAFEDINPMFNAAQMSRILGEEAEEESKSPEESEVETSRPSPREIFAAKLVRLQSRAARLREQAKHPAQDADETSDDLLTWQQEHEQVTAPSVNNTRIPTRLARAGFFASGYLEGYPITGRNLRTTMKELSKAVVSFVRAVRRRRAKLHHLRDRCGEGRSTEKCTRCSKPCAGASEMCVPCRRSEGAAQRRDSAKQRLLLDHTSLRVEALAGRPVSSERLGIDVIGKGGASAWSIKSAQAACSQMRIATLVSGGGVHCGDKHLVKVRAGAKVVAGRLRVTTSVREHRDMIGKPYNRVASATKRGRVKLGVYGDTATDVAVAQDTAMRAVTTRGAKGRSGKLESLIAIRRSHPKCIKTMARAHSLSSGSSSGTYRRALPKERAKIDAARRTKLGKLSVEIRNTAMAGETHWMLFMDDELRSVCTRRIIAASGSRRVLAARLARKLGYNDFQKELKNCAESAREHGREGVHLPPMEVVEMVRGWVGRDVQLIGGHAATWSAPPAKVGDESVMLPTERLHPRAKRCRKQKSPSSLSQRGAVRDETWRITPRLVWEAAELRAEKVRRTRMRRERSGRPGKETERRITRLRELVYGSLSDRSIHVNGKWVKISASSDGREIVVVGNSEGLQKIRPEQVLYALARREPAWVPVQDMLKHDGYVVSPRSKRGMSVNQEQMGDAITALLLHNEHNTYENGPEARRGDVCVFPSGYFGRGVPKSCGVLLTSRTVGTLEGNEKTKAFVDVALYDEPHVWELNIDDPEWNAVIRAGRLRKTKTTRW